MSRTNRCDQIVPADFDRPATLEPVLCHAVSRCVRGIHLLGGRGADEFLRCPRAACSDRLAMLAGSYAVTVVGHAFMETTSRLRSEDTYTAISFERDPEAVLGELLESRILEGITSLSDGWIAKRPQFGSLTPLEPQGAATPILDRVDAKFISSLQEGDSLVKLDSKRRVKISKEEVETLEHWKFNADDTKIWITLVSGLGVASFDNLQMQYFQIKGGAFVLATFHLMPSHDGSPIGLIPGARYTGTLDAEIGQLQGENFAVFSPDVEGSFTSLSEGGWHINAFKDQQAGHLLLVMAQDDTGQHPVFSFPNLE